MRRAAAVALIVGLVLAAPAAGSTILDYLTFDGIDYVRWPEEPGRSLTRADLGLEFASVECSFGEDLRGCPFGRDASAAFLPAGTRVFSVRGHDTSFRLAAVWQDRIFLYQAWRNPRARTGGELWPLAGKVRAIEVRRGERAPRTAIPASDVDALTAMVVRAPTVRPQPRPFGEARYWLTFWLMDGTALNRPYFPDAGELMGGVVVPPAFRDVVERSLTD